MKMKRFRIDIRALLLGLWTAGLMVLSFICLGPNVYQDQHSGEDALILNSGFFQGHSSITWFFVGLLIAIVLYFAIDMAGRWLLTRTVMGEKKDSRSHFLWFFIPLLLFLSSYLTCFAVFYPGTAMNDTLTALASPFNNVNQPIVYQYSIYILFKVFFKITGNSVRAFAGITLIQVFLVAVSESLVVLWLEKERIKKKILICVVLYYWLNPYSIDYSVAVLKDTVFGVAIMLLAVTTFRLIKSQGKLLESKVFILELLFALLLTSLMRTNGFIICFLELVIIGVIFFRHNRKALIKTLIILLILVICTLLKDRAEDMYYNHPQASHLTEALGIPLAQIGAVLNADDGNISEEDLTFLNNIYSVESWKEHYRFSFVDRIKGDSDYNRRFLYDNFGTFMSTWWRIVRDNFVKAVKAFLFHTYGIWNTNLNNFMTNKKSQSYFTSVHNNIGDENYWTQYIYSIGLHEQSLVSEETADSYSGLLYVLFEAFSIISYGMTTLFLLALFAFARKTHNTAAAITIIPCILVWITNMIATPASQMLRYWFYVFEVLPVLVIMTLMREHHFENA